MKTLVYSDFERYMIESEPLTKILSPYAWRDEINELIKSGDNLTGAMLPWQKTHEQIRFRGGEVTLWQGINGHGKSQVLGQAALAFAAQGEGVCIASFEMRPAKTYLRMLRQLAQNANPTEQFSDQMLEWMDEKIWIYDHLGSVQAEHIYAAIKCAAIDIGLKHFVIDNLMKCVKNEDDYNGQKMFVDRICSLSREHNIHIHIVHHVRKGQSENDMPGKFDARGSGTIVDQVDQVITVWRNKKKEEMMRNPVNHAEWQEKPDCILSVDKHRHGEFEGLIGLWYNRQAYFYAPDKRCLTYDLRDTRIYEGQK